ncbi:MAG: ZIP family metal transporter [Planctomycetaceae bacterium]
MAALLLGIPSAQVANADEAGLPKPAESVATHTPGGDSPGGDSLAADSPGFALPGSARSAPHGYRLDSWVVMLIGIYCTLIVLSSLIGGWLPGMIELTHNRMQTMISFVGGLMLGIGVLHLLPHSLKELPSVDLAVGWMMAGIIVMFLLMRLFHFHNHGVAESDEGTPCEHDHEHSHSHQHSHPQTLAHHLSWVGIVIGLSLHTLIDGIALGASVAAGSFHPSVLSLYGVGTFLAIILHKPLDAVSITALMAAGGWKHRAQNLVNTGFALMCPLGAALFLISASYFTFHQPMIIGCGMAFSAGVFVCISLSDLLPEMEFHSHHRLRLSLALALGVALAWAITFIEPQHLH